MEGLTGNWAAILQVGTFVIATGVLIYLFKLGGFFALAQKHFDEEVQIHSAITDDVKAIGKDIHSIDKRISVHDERIEQIVERQRALRGEDS